MTSLARETNQQLLSGQTELHPERASYRLFPVNELQGGSIERGYDGLAQALAPHCVITLDGFAGVRWKAIRDGLDAAWCRSGISVRWTDVADAWLDDVNLVALAQTTLFADDPLFGKLYEGPLLAFFNRARLAAMQPVGATVEILYGCGAALAEWPGLLAYVDVPKNEIQYRARAGSVTNLGLDQALPPNTLVLYGANDTLVPPQAMARAWRHMPAAVQRGYYDGGYHLLMRDMARDKVIGDVIGWMLNRGALPSGADRAAAAWQSQGRGMALAGATGWAMTHGRDP